MRPLGEVVAKPFTVRHTGSELKELADYLNSVDGETRVIIEHTGRYYEPVAQFFHDAGLYVSAVNPKLIKDYGNNSLHKVKTNKADAKKIARYDRKCGSLMFLDNLSTSLLQLCDAEHLSYEQAAERCDCSSKHFANIVPPLLSLAKSL